ncbi:hypothetical protein [Anaerolentibacter hominis]|uniref:hypothetical protein n=1 Tax=Anaerolentibacter hominis TaxID=3079009 RepID=UPI0031B80EDB
MKNLSMKTSIRLTEVYWEIQPAPDSGYWPFADENGTEYILFTMPDGSIGYYKEEDGDNHYSSHTLGIRGTIESMAGLPLSWQGKDDGLAYICVRSMEGKRAFYLLHIKGGSLNCSALRFRDGCDMVSAAGGIRADKKAGIAICLSQTSGPLSENTILYVDELTLKDGKIQTYACSPALKQFGYKPIGPVMVPGDPPSGDMDVFLLCPEISNIAEKKGVRAAIMRSGRMGWGIWEVPDAMYPSKIIQTIQVNLSETESYNLMLIDQNGSRSLWMSSFNAAHPVRYYPLIPPGHLDLKSFSVQGVRRNNQDILSVTGIACNHPGTIFHDFLEPGIPRELNMIPIAENVISYRECVNTQKEHLLYYSTQNSGTRETQLHRLCYDASDDEWEEEMIAGGTTQQFRAVPVYEHRVRVTDEHGLPAPGIQVKVSADTHMILESGGKFWPTDPKTPVMLRTDEAGCLAVYHETHSLSDGDIRMELYPNAQTLYHVFSPAQMQRKRFAELQRPSLQNAKGPEGKYILTPARRQDTKSLDNICTSVRDIAGSKKEGLFASGCAAFVLEKKKDGSIERRKLTSEEFEAMRQEMLQPFNNFWTDLADFFRSVARGIAKVVKAAVKAIGDAVRAVVNFIIDGVEHVIDFITDTVHHIMDTVESVLGMVLEAFDPLFLWLGEIIGIDSILRTQKAVKFLYEESFSVLKDQADKGIRFLRENVQEISSKLDQTIDQLCRSIGADTPSACNARVERVTGAYGDISGNYVTDILLGQVNRSIKLPKDFMEPLRDPAQELLAYLQSIPDKILNEPDFLEAKQYLLSISTSQGNFMNYTLAAMLKGLSGLMKLVLSMTVDLCETVVRLGIQCLDALKRIAEQKISIPVIGILFKKIFRQDLTLLNLISMLIALPAHAAKKLVTDTVPFESESALLQFEREYHSILTQKGGNDRVASEETQNTLTVLCCASQCVVALGVGINDVRQKTGTEEEYGPDLVNWGTIWDFTAVLGNICWTACGIPMFSKENPSVGAYGAWIVCCVNIIIDLGMIKISNMGTESSSTDYIAPVVGCIMGVVYTVFDILNWVSDGIEDGLLFANEIFVCLQSVCRILMFPPLVKVSKGITKVVECCIDSLMGLMGLITVIVKATGNEDDMICLSQA